MGDEIEREMRAVVASHNEECGARAEQMMVNDRLYPDEIIAWADGVARLTAALEENDEAIRRARQKAWAAPGQDNPFAVAVMRQEALAILDTQIDRNSATRRELAGGAGEGGGA